MSQSLVNTTLKIDDYKKQQQAIVENLDTELSSLKLERRSIEIEVTTRRNAREVSNPKDYPEFLQNRKDRLGWRVGWPAAGLFLRNLIKCLLYQKNDIIQFIK